MDSGNNSVGSWVLQKQIIKYAPTKTNEKIKSGLSSIPIITL